MIPAYLFAGLHARPSGFCPVLLTLLVSASGMGCTDGGNRTDDDATIVTTERSDSAGIEIVTNHGNGWGSGRAWRLEPDLQVGELDGPLAFGRISWVSPGTEGGMLVLDRQSHLVHVFDATGQHVREFGGEGDGPGEFRNPAIVTRVLGDRVVVGQAFPPILHWLKADGSYLTSTRLPGARAEARTRTAGTFGLWQVAPDGVPFVSAQVIDPGAEDGKMPVVLLRLAADEALPPDTIVEWTWEAGLGEGPVRVFDPVHTWMPRAGETVLVAPGAPYEYREYDAAQGLLRVVRRDVPPVSVTEEQRKKALEDLRESMESSNAPAQFIDQIINRVVFETELPPVRRVWVSEPDGRVWLGVYDPSIEAEAPVPTGVTTNAWDVFEPSGSYLGRIPAPFDFRLTVVTEDALYGVWQDELEVSFARRYRVVRSEEAE